MTNHKIKKSCEKKCVIDVFSSKSFPLISAGPQKAEKLTALNIKYEKFGPKILISRWKRDITVARISISIENKYFGGDNNITATFNIKACINLGIFMHLKWPWLLRFFAKVL